MTVRLESDNDELSLKISDNGGGLPQGLDTTRSGSMGFDLIKGLARQLKGVLDIASFKGVVVSLRFPL